MKRTDLRTPLLCCVLALVGCGANPGLRDARPTPADAWSVPLSDPRGSWAPHVLDEMILLIGTVSSGDEGDSGHAISDAAEPQQALRRLSAEDGEPRWTRVLDPRPGGAELLSGGGVVLVQRGAVTDAIDADTGAERWRVRYDAPPVAVAVVGGAYVAALPDGIVNVRSAGAGQHRWTIDTSPWQVERIATHDGRALGVARGSGRETGAVAVFDLSAPVASPLWSARTGGAVDAMDIAQGAIAGRFDGGGEQVRALRDGALLSAEGLPIGGRWVGGHYVTVSAQDGVALRVQTLRGHTETGGHDWARSLPTQSAVTLTDVPSIGGFAASTTSYVALFSGGPVPAEVGHVWLSEERVPEEDCTLSGVLADRAVLSCARDSGRALIARPTTPDDAFGAELPRAANVW